MAEAIIRRHDGGIYTIQGGVQIVAASVADVLTKNMGAVHSCYPPEIPMIAQQYMAQPIGAHTPNAEEPLVMPVMNFAPHALAPTHGPGAAGVPSTGPVQHNAVGGQQGGEKPLVMPTMQF